MPYGEFGAYSPDGRQFVYMPMAQDFRNWKRYRGGWAPDLMLFDLERAIKEVMDRVAKAAKAPARPAYERRIPKGGGER